MTSERTSTPGLPSRNGRSAFEAVGCASVRRPANRFGKSPIPLRRSGGTCHRAFTLLELLLAMAVFAAIAAVVIPTSASLLSDRRLVRGTDQLRAEMIRLRVRAMKEGRVMVLKAEQESGTLQVTPLFSASDATEALDQTGSQSSLLSGSEQTVAALNTENQASETAARLIELPEDVLVQGIVTSPVGGSGSVEAASLLIAAEQSSDSEAIETNLPVVYFYPTGQTSNAAITLSHPSAGAAVVRLRGLTGDTTVQELSQ